jgi:hypothetical protein
MNSKMIQAELPMGADGERSLALQCWRLSLLAGLLRDSNQESDLRHAIRRITERLKEMGIKAVDFSMRPYDPGMIPEVVEVREAQGPPDGHAIIDGTIARTVTWRGQVIKPRANHRDAFFCEAAETMGVE